MCSGVGAFVPAEALIPGRTRIFKDEMPDCQLALVWNDPTFGTGPMMTSLDFRVPETTDQMEDTLSAVYNWWEADTNWKPYLYSGLGLCQFIAKGIFGGNVVEETISGGTAPTGLEPSLPGVSFRLVKDTSRPPGGRRGSMYLPGAENSAHSKAGVLTEPAIAALNAGAADLVTAIEAAVVGNYLIQHHNVSEDETTSVVTGLTARQTVSYLNRRYR